MYDVCIRVVETSKNVIPPIANAVQSLLELAMGILKYPDRKSILVKYISSLGNIFFIREISFPTCANILRVGSSGNLGITSRLFTATAKLFTMLNQPSFLVIPIIGLFYGLLHSSKIPASTSSVTLASNFAAIVSAVLYGVA